MGRAALKGTCMNPPGLRLRHAREKLGLTYRDVERASYEIAARRGRPEFILHISRLADIENRNVVPSLHKLYSMAAIYHLHPMQITTWYEVPFECSWQDAAGLPPPLTCLSAPEAVANGGPDPLETSFESRRPICCQTLPASAANSPDCKDSPEAAIATVTSASRTDEWALSCVREVSFWWTLPSGASKTLNGIVNTTAPSILWNCAAAIVAAGFRKIGRG